MKIIFILIIGAGLWACSSVSIKSVNSELIPISGTTNTNSEIEAQIAPYRDSMELEMNEVIAIADTNFIVERPCGNLNNWVADAIFVGETKTVRMSIPIFCLLNTGGIRATINKGNVTTGDIFKIAPFDNEIVWVKMPISSLPKIAEYLKKSGGEPLSNAKLINGILTLNSQKEGATEVIIITSDYLANGGDNMSFFQDRIELTPTGRLLRDVLIQEARIQGTLQSNLENRISF